MSNCRLINEPNIETHNLTKTYAALMLSAAAYGLSEIQGKSFISGCSIFLGTLLIIAGIYTFSRRSSFNSIPRLDHNIDDLQILPPITNEHMAKTDLQNLQDEQLFHIAFGFKRGFADLIEPILQTESPFKHSSIVFVPVDIMKDLIHTDSELRNDYLNEKKAILVLGRQSPAQKCSNIYGLFSSLITDGRKSKQVKTEIDNEANYELFPGAVFETLMSSALLSGKDIKNVIKQVNKIICKDQFCNLAIDSNCYSASVCMLATAIDLLNTKHNTMHDTSIKKLPNMSSCQETSLDKAYTYSEDKHQQIKSLCKVMLDVLEHNYGQGVLNNSVVMERVNIALKIAYQFDLESPKLTEMTFSCSSESKIFKKY